MKKIEQNLAIALIKSELVLLHSGSNNKIINLYHMQNCLKQLKILLSEFLYFFNDGKIVFLLENKGQKLFIEKCLTSLNLKLPIILSLNIEEVKKICGKKFLIVLSSEVSTRVKRLSQILLLDELYVSFFFSSQLSANTFGTYSILGKIDTIKKILFLVVLTIQTIKNANITKI